MRGDQLLAEYPFLDSFADVTFVPLIRGRATPGGILERSAYEQIKQEFLDGLARLGPWDGFYLDMHGALNVEGMDDAEGDWIAATRQVVGAGCVLSASYDLHGNVSARVVEQLDSLTAYRTAPHIDVTETRERACRLSLIPVPLLLPGEKAMTTAEPAGSLYAGLPELIERYGLLDASILVGYCWADERRVGASVVTVGEDAAVVRQAAEALTVYPELRPIARHSLMAFSPGAIDPDVETLPYARILRPAYPLDPAMAWRAAAAP